MGVPAPDRSMEQTRDGAERGKTETGACGRADSAVTGACMKLRVWQCLNPAGGDDPTARACAAFIVLMILLSVLAVVLESVPALGRAHADAFDAFERVAITVFSIEYLLRVWSAPAGGLGTGKEKEMWSGGAGDAPHRPALSARLAYVFSFHGLVDLLATAPFYLQAFFPGLDLRFLRAFRMLRLLKLSHYNSALEDLMSAIVDEHRSFVSALYLFSIALLMSACLAYFAEHAAQPDKFASIPDALWWAVITLTTVGYGDVSPVTPLGKVVGVFTAMTGVCTVALLTGIVASAFANQMARRKAIFEAQLARVLADGQVTPDEYAQIDALRRQFNLSEAHARAMLDTLRAAQVNTDARLDARETGFKTQDSRFRGAGSECEK